MGKIYDADKQLTVDRLSQHLKLGEREFKPGHISVESPQGLGVSVPYSESQIVRRLKGLSKLDDEAKLLSIDSGDVVLVAGGAMYGLPENVARVAGKNKHLFQRNLFERD